MSILILRKSYVTLMEMIIVIFLIGVIVSVVGYNYFGSMEEGRAFKTKTAIEKVETILNLAVAENPDLAESIQDPETWKNEIRRSPLVKNSNDLIKDGWGSDLKIDVQNGAVRAHSDKLNQYEASKKRS